MKAARLAAGLLTCLISLSNLHAHEIESNRLQVVVRDSNHIQLSLWLNLVDAMMVDVPAAAAMPWLAEHAAMSSSDFAAAWQQYQTRLEQALTLRVQDQAVPMLRWAWPASAVLQQQIRTRIMQMTVAPTDHVHAQVLEVRAEGRAPRTVRDIRVQVPPAWQPILITVSRPQQQWLQKGAGSARFEF